LVYIIEKTFKTFKKKKEETEFPLPPADSNNDDIVSSAFESDVFMDIDITKLSETRNYQKTQLSEIPDGFPLEALLLSLRNNYAVIMKNKVVYNLSIAENMRNDVVSCFPYFPKTTMKLRVKFK